MNPLHWSLTTLLALATLTTTSPTPLRAREELTTTDDLNTIDSNTLALTDAINAYTGGLTEALPIQSASDTLTTTLQSASTGPGTFADDAEAQAAVKFATEVLAPHVEACATALVGKKDAFDAAGASVLVKQDLQTISDLAMQLGQTLLDKNPAYKDNGGQDAVDRINKALGDALTAFS